MFHIYKITNTKNGKCYIGMTSREVNARWQEHLSRYRCNDRNSRIYAAMRKYGAEIFEVETLDSSGSESRIREMECEYIIKFDSYEKGYNANIGGNGFLVFPDEIRKKISEAQKGKIISKETRKKMSLAKIGDSRCANNFGDHTKKGSGNPRAKYLLIEFPDGHVEVAQGVRAFCKEYGLQHAKFSSTGKTKGFKKLGTFNDYPEREYAQASGNGAAPTL